MDSSLIIVGTGGHAISIANVAHGSGMNVIAFVDDNKAGSKLLDIPIITKHRSFKEYQQSNYAIAIGDNFTRECVSLEYKSIIPSANFPSIIHPSAVIGIGTELGEGNIIMPLVNVGPSSKVGNFCILNTSSSIDHECEMKSFSSIAPRVVTGGKVTIGKRSIISIGSTIKHGVIIGNDVLIGSNSYVNKNIENNIVSYGNPSRFVRKRLKSDSYLQ